MDNIFTFLAANYLLSCWLMLHILQINSSLSFPFFLFLFLPFFSFFLLPSFLLISFFFLFPFFFIIFFLSTFLLEACFPCSMLQALQGIIHPWIIVQESVEAPCTPPSLIFINCGHRPCEDMVEPILHMDKEQWVIRKISHITRKWSDNSPGAN